MPRFANALNRPDDPASLQLAWLAGLLEGEGTFLRPPPSMPNCPIVACRMTDRDIIERVAICFGTQVLAIDKGRYRTEFAATMKGSRAVTFMTDVRSLMGDRRRLAIDAAIQAYDPPRRKLDFEAAEEIRRRSVDGETTSSLARAYRVTPQTIRPILRGEIYASAPPTPWRDAQNLPLVVPHSDLSQAEIYWLAGWLEGEGSFMAPPPSDPRRPRISAQARDGDVVAEAGRLLTIKPLLDKSSLQRNPTWSAMWRVLLQGRRAVSMMLAIQPLMGARRQQQIHTAIGAASAAQAKRFSQIYT